MNKDELEQVLSGFEGATFAGLDTETIPTLTGGKSNPFQGKVLKRCLGHSVMLFTNKLTSGYDNMVKRRLKQAGLDPASFTMGALPWGKRLDNSPLIVNKDKHYLQCVFLGAGSTEFVALDTIKLNPNTVWNAGDSIARYMLTGLREETGSEHQGLERDSQVIVRTYALDSIVAIRCMGTELH